MALAVTDALNEIYDNLDSGLPPSPSKTIRWGELMAVLGVSSTIMEELWLGFGRCSIVGFAWTGYVTGMWVLASLH